MNEVVKNILTRRSVRAFTDEPLPREQVEELVRAAQYAPSARNLQTWEFTVVLDRAKIQKLCAAVGTELGKEGYDMYRPVALIIPSNHKDTMWGRDDNACALQNIFLAAHSLGIGSVWINQLQGICDAPAVRAVLDELGIPADHLVYGIAALGYAAQPLPTDVQKTGKVRFVE